MFHRIISVVIIVGSLTMLSCDRISNKTKQLKDRVEYKVQEKVEGMEDRIIARFDADEPDTKFNKQRFEDMFGFAPTEDVKGIFGRSDNMGIDHTYYLSFQCHDSTARKISRSLGLRLDSTWQGSQITPFYTQEKDPWWDSTFTQRHAPWSQTTDQVHSHLWFDAAKGKAYFVTYDM